MWMLRSPQTLLHPVTRGLVTCKITQRRLSQIIQQPLNRAHGSVDPSCLRSMIKNNTFPQKCGVLQIYRFSSTFISVLGTGGNELHPSFIVKSEKRFYIFNCVESICRCCGPMLKRVKSMNPIVFFTRASCETRGGEVSLYFKQPEPRDNLQYCGPLQYINFLRIARAANGLASWRPVEDQNSFCDDNMNVSAIRLTVPGDKQRNDSVVAYACKLSDSRGKFNVKKAIELGVPEGPAYRCLVLGESVTTESGNVVHPSQVVGEPNLGPSFLVVDCPDKYFLEAICSHHKLEPEWFKEKGEKVKLIVHITPLHILQTEQYSKWMASFGVGVDHLFLHASVCPGEVSLRRAMSFSMPFHLMNPEVYHFPRIPNENKLCLKEMNVMKYLKEDSLVIGKFGLKYHLKPSVKLDLSETLKPLKNHLEMCFKSLHVNKLSSNIQAYRKSISAKPHNHKKEVIPLLMENSFPASHLDNPNDCMVTILGTSASLPTSIRNVSGILVRTLSEGNVLLDCGEGTLQQMYRCFGASETNDILRNLRTIFVSHMHGDHWIGLVAILNELSVLRKGQEHPFTIIGPGELMKIVTRFSIYKKINFCGICSSDIMQNPYHQMKLSLKTVQVNHIKNSYGIIVKRGDDWSIVYSGDTAPCPNLVREGKNATLLIHEGTLDDIYSYSSERDEMRHTTYSEAINISKAMNANFTIITHFSNTDENFALKRQYWAPKVVPAVDLMSVKLSDIQRQRLDSSQCREIFDSVAVFMKVCSQI